MKNIKGLRIGEKTVDMKKQQLQTAFSTRQYMLSEDFEIYYYNDHKLSGVEAHSHDYYEFYFFVEGDVEICIGSERHKLTVGDVIIIPPGTSHYPLIKSHNTPYRRFVLWLSSDYVKRLTEASVDYAYILQRPSVTKEYIFHHSTIEFNTMQSMIFQLIEETKNNRFGKAAQVSLLINGLVLYLNRLAHEHSSSNTYTERELYLRICDYVEENLEGSISLQTIADEFFVSKYYAAHNFKDNMGISLHQYILKKRLNACKNAFTSGTTIGEVCEQFGFYDYSAFYRAFKKEYGVSPKRFLGKERL